MAAGVFRCGPTAGARPKKAPIPRGAAPAFAPAVSCRLTCLYDAGVRLFRCRSPPPSRSALYTRWTIGRVVMEVNLRKLYPTLYSSDVFVEVSDEVFEAIRAFERAEAAWQRRKYRYRAQYSLDYGNGIENDLLLWPETPEEAFEAKMMRREIFEALHALPAAQKLRVYARYFLEEKPRQIARREGVHPSRVYTSLKSGLRTLRRKLAHLARRPPVSSTLP